jgi:branched-chain amino acid transport system permease protein
MKAAVLLAVAAVALAFPLVGSEYYTTLLLSFLAYTVVLLGLNLLFGYAGLLSFGHALFIGIGAYTAGFFTTNFGIRSFELILASAAILGALVAVPVGAFCVRYVKIYFGMLTLAFSMLFYSFLIKFYAITGGDEGIRVARPVLLGLDLSEVSQTRFLTWHYYYYSVAVVLIALAVMWRIVRSPFGLCLQAVRENPAKAEALGVSSRGYRWAAFVISGAYAAVGGALLGPTTGQVDPAMAYWTQSGNLVFMTLLGGFTSFFGPVLGAFVFIFLQDQVMAIMQYWRLVFGAILALIVIFVPGGLMSVLDARRP